MVVPFLTAVPQVLRPSVQEWALPGSNPDAAPCTQRVLSQVLQAVQDSVPEWVPVLGSVSAQALVAQEWVHPVSRRRLRAKRRGRSVRDPAAGAVRATRKPKKAQ